MECLQITQSLLFYINFTFLSSNLCRDGGELSTRDLQKIVQALPQYSEQVDKLSLHVEVCSSSTSAIFLFKGIGLCLILLK